jgi:hypothetical protein
LQLGFRHVAIFDHVVERARPRAVAHPAGHRRAPGFAHLPVSGRLMAARSIVRKLVRLTAGPDRIPLG